MDKTLFVASFPDLSGFDFSKTDIKVTSIDNSDYYFNRNNSNYIHSYVNSLKGLIGNSDIIFVPANDNIVSALSGEGIKCVVLYPNLSCKEKFLEDLAKCGFEEEYVSMIRDSWDFIISRLDKRNYDYKFVMADDDNVLDVLRLLLSKRDKLGIGGNDVSLLISDELVDNLFSYCILSEDEIIDGNPKIQSTFCEGIKYDYLFSTKRLSDKKDNIKFVIDSIMSIEDGVSVSNMGVNKNGVVWTNSMDTLEKIMVLGISSGDLLLPFPRSFDNSLKGSVPFVIKSDSLGKNLV